MSGLRNLVDKLKPTFSEGGKLVPRIDLRCVRNVPFVPNTTTSRGAHIRDCNDMKRTMIVVVVALMPALLFGMYNTGYQVGMTGWAAFWFGFLKVLPMIVVSYVVGLGIEFFFAQKRGHEVNEGFLVSGLLIPMIMPVGTPLWMIALGTAFAVIFGKEVFGGTGMNVFNPALVARAFVFFAYTPFISGEKVWFADDAVSGATALEQARYERCDELFDGGRFPGIHSRLRGRNFDAGDSDRRSDSALYGRRFVAHDVVRLYRRPGNGILFPGTRRDDLPAWEHLIVGGFAFGAVFMATDPVTSAQTRTGQYIVGFLTGALAVLIRVVNPAYPEGMMLAILFMNALAPLVDYCVVESSISRRKKRVKLVK